MPNIDLIARAVEVIEARLQEPLPVAAMADAVACSLYHFCRIFNDATHHTPYDYLMRRRLSEAALALLKTDQKIIDIAYAYQFNNPETFSRAFKRMFDLQPNQLRKQRRLGRWAYLPRLTRAHLAHMAKGPYLTPVLEEKAAFRVAGLMTLVPHGQTPGAVLWDSLAQMRAGSLAQPANTPLYGLAFYPDEGPTDDYWYLAGFEAPDSGDLPLPFVTQTVPASKYARFIHKGPWHELPLTLDYSFYTWLPQSGQRLARPLVVEGRPLSDPERDAAESPVYLPLQ